LKDPCNWLICFSQSSAQKRSSEVDPNANPSTESEIDPDPPIKHPKTTQINSSLSHHHHLAVNFSAWQLHTEHSPAKDSSACNCPKTLKKSLNPKP
jgi:hypothetical protein